MLAIVIPYYKITFFEETLRSLVNQSDKRFKVYIGNDASPDDPSKLLESFSSNLSFRYHKFENNLGGISLAKQWERCIDLIEDEEWIMILGDDDVLSENVVQTWYRDYSKFSQNTNVVRFATQVIFEKNGTLSKIFKHPEWEKASDSYFRKAKGQTRSSLSEYIFTKKVYTQFGFHNFPLAWYSDDRAWIEFAAGKEIYTLNDSLVQIRISEENISGQTHNEDRKAKAREQFLGDFILKNLYPFQKKQRFELLLEYEVVVKEKRKLTQKEWFSLISLYAKEFRVWPFIKVVRRYIRDLYK